MFEKLKNSRLLFWSVEILILATILLVGKKIDFFFTPVATFFSTLFAPILIAGFLYYLLNPLVRLLEKIKVKRIWGIVIVFILLIAVIGLVLFTFIPYLANQAAGLAKNLPVFAKEIEAWLRELSQRPFMQKLDIQQYFNQFDLSYTRIISNILNGISVSLSSVFSALTSVAMLVITVPFILFYMLKDGEKVKPSLGKMIPEKYQKATFELLDQMNYTISTYISGQAIECLFVATFTFVGYLLVGVDYAFLFGVIAGLTNLIPYIGPYLGLMPALAVTIFDSPVKAVLCCVVVLIVQQVDGNVIYPNVIGKSLQIHPLTIILILLVAGNLAGLLGIFLGVPIYAICKTIIIHFYNIFKLKDKKETLQKLTVDLSVKDEKEMGK